MDNERYIDIGIALACVIEILLCLLCFLQPIKATSVLRKKCPIVDLNVTINYVLNITSKQMGRLETVLQ